MAKKDNELGKMIRDTVSAVELEAGETIDSVKLIISINVTNSKTKSSYTKRVCGRSLENYNKDIENIKTEW